jgi:hypothetical protein
MHPLEKVQGIPRGDVITQSDNRQTLRPRKVTEARLIDVTGVIHKMSNSGQSAITVTPYARWIQGDIRSQKPWGYVIECQDILTKHNAYFRASLLKKNRFMTWSKQDYNFNFRAYMHKVGLRAIKTEFDW